MRGQGSSFHPFEDKETYKYEIVGRERLKPGECLQFTSHGIQGLSEVFVKSLPGDSKRRRLASPPLRIGSRIIDS